MRKRKCELSSLLEYHESGLPAASVWFYVDVQLCSVDKNSARTRQLSDGAELIRSAGGFILSDLAATGHDEGN